MAKKKDNKSLIMAICGVVAAIVLVVVIAVVVMTKKGIDESFFVSDDTKYVLSLDVNNAMMDIDTDEYVPEKAYLIYFYSGDEVTGLKMYYKYADNATAKKAAETLNGQKSESDEIEKVEADGDYVIITAGKTTYEGMTAEDAKQQVEFMEMLQNMNFDDSESEDDETTEEVTTEE